MASHLDECEECRRAVNAFARAIDALCSPDDVDRSELVRLNGLRPPYSIPLGQKLMLPTPGSAAEARTTEVAYAPPAAGSPPAVSRVNMPASPTAAKVRRTRLGP